MMNSMSNSSQLKQLYNAVISNSTVNLTYTAHQQSTSLTKRTCGNIDQTIGLLTSCVVEYACYYSAYIKDYVVGSVNAYLNEKIYQAVYDCGEWLTGLVGFVSNVTTIINNMMSITKSGSTGKCGGILLTITDTYAHSWTAAILTWESSGDTPCFTSVAELEAKSVLDEALESAESKSMIGFCVPITNSGAFRGDLRFQWANLSYKIWDIPCAY